MTRKDKSEDTSEDTFDQLKERNDFVIDLDSLVPQAHNWVDRGLVMSCENAGHPNHRSFKISKGRVKAKA